MSNTEKSRSPKGVFLNLLNLKYSKHANASLNLSLLNFPLTALELNSLFTKFSNSGFT